MAARRNLRVAKKKKLVSGFYFGAPMDGRFSALFRYDVFCALFILFVIALLRGEKREKLTGFFALFLYLLSMGKQDGFYPYIPFITVFRFPSNWLFLFNFFFVLTAASSLRFFRGKIISVVFV